MISQGGKEMARSLGYHLKSAFSDFIWLLLRHQSFGLIITVVGVLCLFALALAVLLVLDAYAPTGVAVVFAWVIFPTLLLLFTAVFNYLRERYGRG